VTEVLTVARNKGNLSPLRKKLHVVKGYESNELMVDITIAMGIAESTLRAKGTGNSNATAISDKCRRFQAGNWFPE
jgi:hypothetical protein